MTGQRHQSRIEIRKFSRQRRMKKAKPVHIRLIDSEVRQFKIAEIEPGIAIRVDCK
jgi:hypothetical protein